MRRFLTWIVFTAMMGGIAHAKSAKLSIADWKAVQQLAPGTEVYVQAGNMAGPDFCRVSSVDDSGLTCLEENYTQDARLIFPREQVQDVWVFEEAPNRHILRGIFALAGAGLLIALIVENPLAAIVIGLPVLYVLEAAANDPFRPVPPPRPPRMRRRLVYHAATP
ncbi:MAG TPA: hypothetical protein VGU46_00570 [Acidobacteriaceae bacterium]|nr:hypothetical protein [Acidobacteriaceae bacterium]